MWNYRLVKIKDGVSIVLAEVFFNDDGTPYGYVDAKAMGDSPEEVKESYGMMAEAFDKPVLYENDFVEYIGDDNE